MTTSIRRPSPELSRPEHNAFYGCGVTNWYTITTPINTFSLFLGKTLPKSWFIIAVDKTRQSAAHATHAIKSQSKVCPSVN